MEKILVLEDEVDIGNLVAFNLRRNGYDAEVEHDGREGLGRILKEQPDLVTQIRFSYSGCWISLLPLKQSQISRSFEPNC